MVRAAWPSAGSSNDAVNARARMAAAGADSPNLMRISPKGTRPLQVLKKRADRREIEDLSADVACNIDVLFRLCCDSPWRTTMDSRKAVRSSLAAFSNATGARFGEVNPIDVDRDVGIASESGIGVALVRVGADHARRERCAGDRRSEDDVVSRDPIDVGFVGRDAGDGLEGHFEVHFPGR